MTAPASATLLLFDIDGTLMSGASGPHAQALRDAAAAVHDVDVSDPAIMRSIGSVAGRTDNEIARLMLRAVDVSEAQITAHAAEVCDYACARYAELCPRDISEQVIPGIPDLLGWLADRPNVVLSLVTGNFEAIAHHKLGAGGIGQFFALGQGGFGSDAEVRAELPGIARARAGRIAGLADAFPADRTILIGDTPRDIACARADGIRVIAVTTGPHAAVELGEADAIATDAPGLRGVLQPLL